MQDLARAVRKLRTLTRAWRAIQQNGRLSKSPDTRAEVAAFAEDAPRKLDRILRQLRNNTFVFLPSKGIKKKKPSGGFRPLVLAPLENRIVQRAIHDVLLDIPAVVALVKTPWSFGGIRKDRERDEFASVPAAVKAVLDAIGDGGLYLARRDISGFFTKIPKSEVRNSLAKVIPDEAFLELFDRAVAAELSNLADLRNDAKAFPIEDIGIAQGNSLSPLLGNILLRDFDEELNALPGIKCIRFIDDFIIIGPNKPSVTRALTMAEKHLAKWDMRLSEDKSEQGSTQQRFEFLGIEFNNGLLRPTKRKQQEFLVGIEQGLQNSQKALFGFKSGKPIRPNETVIRTLKTLSDGMKGWAMSYRFCNDKLCFKNLDAKVATLVTSYLQTYRAIQKELGPSTMWELMGIESLEKVEKNEFTWPKLRTNVLPSTSQTAP